MTPQDSDFIKKIEHDWVYYIEKSTQRDEIPWQAESVMAKIQIYEGDLPQSGAYKPDSMPRTIDKYRKFYITEDELFAARVMVSIPKTLQPFVMFQPLLAGRPKITQELIAAMCGCNLSRYKNQRHKAKLFLLARGHEMKSRKRVGVMA